MAERTDLHWALCDVLGVTEPDGDRHIYFNPPPSVSMKYPAIKYSLNRISDLFASNGSYRRAPSYEITLIDYDPDSKYVDKILKLPYCSFDRFYVANNLNHWTFTIYNL